MNPDSHWMEGAVRKVLSLFSTKEVKTPLSFFFRVISAIVIIAIFALFSLDSPKRYDLLIGAAILLVFMVLVVAVFAWRKPKNLVYGEAGHRAEMKMAWGTERQTFTAAEVSTLPGMGNPGHEQPAGGGDAQ